MKKIKTSKKDMKDNLYIVGIGYCNAQQLLKAFDPIAYSAGRDGWACDYYNVDDVIISTGYSYIDSKRTKHTYKQLKAVELKADAIWSDYSLTYKQRLSKVKRLMKKFLNDSIKRYKESKEV